MGRRHIRYWDEERTELLNQPELFVQKKRGSDHYFYAWLQEPEVEKCPLCSGKVIKIQDLFSKTYRDLIYEADKPVIVLLEYEFHKYRCLNSECHHIFAKEIHFASRNDNVTYRLENKIAQLVMEGYTYGQICELFDGSITRQAVGQIFNRWVRKRDEPRMMQSPPASIAVLSGWLDRDRYTLILNLDHGIRIFDILYGVQAADIAAVFEKIGVASIKTVLSDCTPTIVETIKDCLPGALHIIPGEYWLKLVEEDFSEFAHDAIRWSPIPDKDWLIFAPPAEIVYRSYDLDRLLDSKPIVRQPHSDMNALRAIMSPQEEMWVYEELVEWAENTDSVFKECLSATITQLELHRPEIEAHTQHREMVPERLCALTSRIESMLSDMRTFSAEVLRARVLYSSNINKTDLQNWHGVPIEDSISALDALNGGNKQ